MLQEIAFGHVGTHTRTSVSILLCVWVSDCLQVSKFIQEGKLRPTIEKVLPLAEAAAAHELLEGGHVRGKLVLQVADLQ